MTRRSVKWWWCALAGILFALGYHIVARSQTMPLVAPPPADIVAVSPATVDVTNAGGGAAFSTAGTNIALALPAGSFGIGTSSTATVGNVGQGGRFVLVCGPTAGTASLLFYAGTNNTPIVLGNAIGGGLIGC